MFNRLRNNHLTTLVVSLMLWTPYLGLGQHPIDEIKQESKAAKLTPDLLSFKQEAQQGNLNQKTKNLRQAASPDNETGLTKVNRAQVHDGLIAIEGVTNQIDGQALLDDLQALGLQQGRYHKRIVFGYFPIDKLDQLKNVKTLQLARPAYAAFKNVGKTTSQGDSVMRADKARQNYGVTGAGSKVGIISDSYNSLGGAAAGVASGDLPANVQVLQDIPAIYQGSDEGRGMAELVHDVAPGAGIAFHTGYETQIDFANGILNLAAAGCNIIVDDLTYYAEPFFQDGVLAQVVDYVVKEWNVSYFSSAGNNARQSYQSGFRNSGKPAPGLPLSWGHAHDFSGTGTILQKVVIQPRGEFFPILQWSDPFYSQGAIDLNRGIIDSGILGAKTDLDILVYYKGVLQVGLSSLDPNISGDPVEAIDFVNNTNAPIELEIAIVKYDGPDPSLIKWVDFGYLSTAQFATQSSTTYGHANAEKAIAVGATPWYQTPAFNPNRYRDPLIEDFSSAGGTPILFTEYGQPIPSKIRKKPQIVAPDGGNTSFFGFLLNDGDSFPNFFGTSASAPHAAAAAALLQERVQNRFSPDEVLKRFEETALDMDDPSTLGFDVGFDYRTGYGFIQVDKALMFGQPLAILEPVLDCQTRKITLRTNGGDGTPIKFTVPGVQRTSPTSTTLVAQGYSGTQIVYSLSTPESTTGIIEAGVFAEGKPLTIIAEQNGVKVTYTFNFVEYCSRPRTFTLVQPLYNCTTGAITFLTQGGDGSPVTFSAPGVKRSSPTDPNGTVEAGLLYDPMPIVITAVQSGQTARYLFNFVAYCNSRARQTSDELASGLQISVFNNPLAADWVELEVRGAQGQPLQLQVRNAAGALSSEQSVSLAQDVERQRVRLGGVSGLYLLQVSTPSQSRTVKIIRQ